MGTGGSDELGAGQDTMSNPGIGQDPRARTQRPIQENRLPPDPLTLLRMWLPSDDDPARPAATLATVDRDGMPNARTVLLSSSGGGRPAFHTDATSVKVQELNNEPMAALVLLWSELGRQIVLRGHVVRTSAEVDLLAYARRSRYLQLLAWLNTPEAAHSTRAEREHLWAEFDERHQVLSAPETWVGYELVPTSIAFWEGSALAPGRRARYTRSTGGWRVEILPG